MEENAYKKFGTNKRNLYINNQHKSLVRLQNFNSCKHFYGSNMLKSYN